jgi:3-hydroxyisobutyrate dehydrogenase-like beta-hydroxyacid dehydrogenase
MEAVGIVGVGIMGGAFAKNLRAAGIPVVAFDLSADALDRIRAQGGSVAASPAEVADRARVVITSLPTEAALSEAIEGAQGLTSSRANPVVIEMSTMRLSIKESARKALADAGKTMLDCPVSGTGAQAANRDLVVFGSGERAAWDSVAGIFPAMSRQQHYLGEFGNGSKMKYLANVLVNIHNVAAAETFALAGKAGMDLSTVFEVLKDSAGTSRMFQVRGPLMVEQDYDQPTARIGMFMKDLDIISEFASDLRCPMPLFSVATQMYFAALNNGRADQDTAAVCAVVEGLSGITRQ